MEMRGGMDGLRSLLGIPQSNAPSTVPVRNSATAQSSAPGADHATLSSFAQSVALGQADGDVRMEKVAGIQAALAAGTYNVSAGAVASRLVDAMLAGDR